MEFFQTTQKGYVVLRLVKNFLLPYIGTKRPVLLILDNHIYYATFTDAAKEILEPQTDLSNVLGVLEKSYWNGRGAR